MTCQLRSCWPRGGEYSAGATDCTRWERYHFWPRGSCSPFPSLSVLRQRSEMLDFSSLHMLGLCAFGVSGLAAGLAGMYASWRKKVWIPRWQWAILAVSCPAIAVFLAPRSNFGAAAPVEAIEPPRVEWLPPLKMMPGNSAVTDQGHDLTLWRADIDVNAETRLADAARRELSRDGLTGRAIQRAPADRFSNCHGWVFTGGQFLIPDHVVDSILSENGYAAVEQPAAGDLVIYRDERGAAVHSATVWAIGEDGRALLESKWAWMGRFIHVPDNTPYGQKWQYYHSSRSGHFLKGDRESLSNMANQRRGISK